MARKRTCTLKSNDGWLHIVTARFLRFLKKESELMGDVKVYHVENPYEPEPEKEYSGVNPRFYLHPKVPIIEEVKVSETIPYYLVPMRNNRREEKKWVRATSVGDAVIVHGTYGDFGREF